MVHLKCQDCGGELDVDASKQILSCPYCHSKQVIIESDEVKIATIKSSERKTIASIESEERKTIELAKNKSNEDITYVCLGIGFFVFIFILLSILTLLGF
jgi:DNA-directed RNA polymerase subunit RPC12/RpoP